ncbi:Alpha-terpineol synthase, chloroplastic, partial [Ananas comosus]
LTIIKIIQQSEAQIAHIAKLKENVKQLMYKEAEPAAKLKLVDTVQRLGMAYHFEEEIQDVLDSISIDKAKTIFKEDVLSMALLFRLLRENCFPVSQDLFSGFKEGESKFKSYLKGDTKGLLSLYEASYLAFEGEELLDEARIFAIKHLNELKPHLDPHLRGDVAHALELPLHWRAPRLETRWFIDKYGKDEQIDPIVLQLAKLDFNKVQSIHQGELRRMSGWWRDIAFGEKLPFARDRLTECFFFATGIVYDPRLGYCREGLTKILAIITNLDDFYDIFGTLDELVLFTNAIERWDINAVEGLPEYMKVLYSTIYNTSNEMAYALLREGGVDALPYLRKTWHDLCKAFLVEAKWYHNGYKPTSQENLENGWMSSSGNVILVHAITLLREKVTKEVLQQLENYPVLVRSPSMIFRLCNDLATHTAEKKRGDAPTSIDCYMREHGSTEATACEAIRDLIINTWKKINEDAFVRCRFPRSFANAAMNLGRISHCIYQDGDGIGSPDQVKKNQVRLLFLEPVAVGGSQKDFGIVGDN